MTAIPGALARLDRSRDELAKAWLIRLIERASLDEIEELPTKRLARELPPLIADLVGLAAGAGGDPYALSEQQAERAAGLALLRDTADTNPGEVALDISALQSVLVRALGEELAEAEPERFADAVVRLADATGAIQAAAVEELVRRRSRELETQAHTDPLTGLGNRRHLERSIAQMLELHKRYGQPFGVLVIDVDGLKRINDAHGHQAGDRMLMQVAMSLRRSIRTVDVPARLGGDEFCVLAPAQESEAAVKLAERLSAAVQEDVAAPDMPPLSVSIGVVSCPSHGDDAERLLEGADSAMYQAKAAGESVSLSDPPASP